MTVYRKSFSEGTALLVHRLIEGSKDPNVLKRAQAVYCRAGLCCINRMRDERSLMGYKV